jgi:minor extracellular serine protease Vpr
LSKTHIRLAATAGTVVAIASLATAQWASGAPTGSASGSPARFDRVSAQTVSGKYVQGLNNNRQLTVMVQAAGRPIARVQAHEGHTLSHARWNQVRADIKAEQEPIAAAVRALGGKVGNSYQAAYNGMKVTIAAGKLGELSNIPNVVGVHALTPKSFDNIHGVPLIGAPQVWDGVAGVNGIAGEGIKIAVIDTGIDYTHADFGGPGTVDAYKAALATDTAPADPAMFGPAAPRVKGGYDFVGDDYNADPSSADYQPVPHPDPNPLDCNGHGTHTAGTAAGSGVLSDGSTYPGPYQANTISSHNWNVGPGVAPKSDIYSLRVFGCAGSTDVVVDAIEWAVNNHMNVINMSLGSPFGGPDDPDAVASNNAAQAGTIVATSAGNSGPNPYLVGTPSTGDGVISTAASDPTQSFPAANIALPGGTTVQAIEANGVPVDGLSAPIKVLYTGTTHDAAHISLGCDPAEYTAAGVAGDIVVVKRGTCARVARAIFGQQAGAAAVIMVNSSDTFPPYEGPITSNPDTGVPYTVTIPFLGVKSSAAPALVAADGGTATLADTTLPNPGYLATASFSSGGPRSDDSALKPDLTAPGVSIASAGMGTGNGLAILSGTSMASPHVAGAAALVRQAHPSWGAVKYWKAALVNTADPSLVTGYQTRMNGTGLAQVQHAVATKVVALGVNDTATLSYGYAELSNTYSQSRLVRLRNFSNQPITFTVGKRLASGSPHAISFTANSVTVPANGQRSFGVTLSVKAKTAGDSAAFHDVAGQITLTPTNGANNGVGLAVAYYLVPQALSKVHTALDTKQLVKLHSTVATVSNNAGAITGNADWYAWGVSDPKEAALGSNDVQAVGVQSFPDDEVLAFGLSTYKRWSNAASDEFDIYVDVNGDDQPDYVVVEADYGLVTTGSNDGRTGSFVFNLATGDGSIEYFADAPTDSSSMALPVGFDQLCDTASPCLSPSNPRFTYYAVGFGRDGSVDEPGAQGSFNAFTPSLSTGMYDTVAPGQTVSQPVTLNAAEFAQTPARGFMVLSHDNQTGQEAQLISLS